jgi:hypothetical protein
MRLCVAACGLRSLEYPVKTGRVSRSSQVGLGANEEASKEA